MSWLVIQDELFSYGLLPPCEVGSTVCLIVKQSLSHTETQEAVVKSSISRSLLCLVMLLWERSWGWGGDGEAVNVKWNGGSYINQSRRKCLHSLSCLSVHSSPHILHSRVNELVDWGLWEMLCCLFVHSVMPQSGVTYVMSTWCTSIQCAQWDLIWLAAYSVLMTQPEPSRGFLSFCIRINKKRTPT